MCVTIRLVVGPSALTSSKFPLVPNPDPESGIEIAGPLVVGELVVTELAKDIVGEGIDRVLSGGPVD
jgi:hypothetical protein